MEIHIKTNQNFFKFDKFYSTSPDTPEELKERIVVTNRHGKYCRVCNKRYEDNLYNCIRGWWTTFSTSMIRLVWKRQFNFCTVWIKHYWHSRDLWSQQVGSNLKNKKHCIGKQNPLSLRYHFTLIPVWKNCGMSPPLRRVKLKLFT